MMSFGTKWNMISGLNASQRSRSMGHGSAKALSISLVSDGYLASPLEDHLYGA
jgi:hypothetical protein